MPNQPKDPCGVCHKNVNNNHNSFQCDLCNYWVHIRCNYLNKNDYNKLKKDPNPFLCINCIKDSLPFSNITDNELVPLLTKGIILPDNVDSSTFSPNSLQIQSHINSLNAYLNKSTLPPDDDGDDDEDDNNISPINCNYYEYEEFSNSTPLSHFQFYTSIFTPSNYTLRVLGLSCSLLNLRILSLTLLRSQNLK